MKVFLTAKDSDLRLTQTADLSFEKNPSEMEVINVHDDLEFQTIKGFGGAFTESFCYTMSKMSEENRNKVLNAYFGPDGIGYSVGRVHMGSCDFSTGHYSCIEEGDMDLSTFHIERDKKWILPTLKKAMEINGTPLKMLVSPWSPPAHFKTNKDRNHGGKLLDECKKAWAEHYVKFIDAYWKEGVPIWAVTVQNEPAATQTWASCVYTAEEEGLFVRDYLYPALKNSPYLNTKIFIWDHNKVMAYERARDTLNIAGGLVDGVGVHWYGGDHFEALDFISRRYPDKELVFTEGCQEEAEQFLGKWCVGERYAHDIIGNMNHNLTTFLDWNLALDEKGGPNHVGNYCSAPIILDTAKDEISFENSYYYIGHFSKFIRPGAKRLGTSRYTEKIDALAVKNPDGGIVLVVLNREEKKMPVNIVYHREQASMEMPPRSIATFLF